MRAIQDQDEYIYPVFGRGISSMLSRCVTPIISMMFPNLFLKLEKKELLILSFS